jgi:hypothetical protein
MSPWIVAAIALVFVALAGYSIATGEARFGRPPFRFRVKRAESPAGFWFTIAVYVAIAATTIVVGWPES